MVNSNPVALVFDEYDVQTGCDVCYSKGFRK